MDPIGIGVIGCGNVSSIYLANLPLYRDVVLRGCADLRPEVAAAQAARYGIEAMTLDAMLADPRIGAVVNLTVPNAHAEVSLAALAAGKHVFSEKPLATTVADGQRICDEAARRGLKVGVAPDTFLGAGGRLARRLVDDGAIGTVVAGTAFVMSRGMEHWHPNPEFFFKPGGGPVLDVGPYYLTALVNLLGPIARVAASTAIGLAERVITADSPLSGQRIEVETPTTILALLEFESGARITLSASWDVWRHGHAPIELYGVEGSLRLADPNFYGGTVELAERGGEWRPISADRMPFGAPNWPDDAPTRANYRGLGVAELASAVTHGTPHRCDAGLGLHVLEVMHAILRSGETGSFVTIDSRCPRPEALGDEAATALLAPAAPAAVGAEAGVGTARHGG